MNHISPFNGQVLGPDGFLHFTEKEGILEYKTLASANTSDMKKQIRQRLRVFREAEDKCVVPDYNHKGRHSRSSRKSTVSKDIECQQMVE